MTVLFVVTTMQLFGQSTGTLTGTVTDASGVAITQANVTIKNDASGLSQSVVTNSSGGFVVSNLPPGTYTVGVEMTGYGPLTRENVQIAAGQPVKLTLGMQEGSNSATVEVAGDAPMVQDQNAEISRGYDARVVSQLPLQDRNSEQLVELMPGNTPPLPSGSALNDPQQSCAS